MVAPIWKNWPRSAQLLENEGNGCAARVHW
jgi:hypothetical protein